jgi:ABC-type polysaccharide/polyol phosphate export permease
MVAVLQERKSSPGPRSLSSGAREDIIGGLRKNELWARLGWREVKGRYRRTKIGPFWSTLALAIYIVAVGAVGAGLWGQDIKVYLPYLASGMMVWTFLSSIINESGQLYVQGNRLVQAVQFEYAILPYALVWRHFVLFVHNLVVYAFVILLDPGIIRWETLLAIPGMVIVVANGVWLALLIGLICLRFRDVQQIVQSALQVGFLVTPVFWSADALSGLTKVVFVQLNPLYRLIEIVRTPLLGGVPTLASYLGAIGITLFGWVITYLMFRAFRKRISYWG